MKKQTFAVYCRGCNKAVMVDEETETEYIERSEEYGTKRHPKQDCDKIYP